jgi:hypothetical protein
MAARADSSLPPSLGSAGRAAQSRAVALAAQQHQAGPACSRARAHPPSSHWRGGPACHPSPPSLPAAQPRRHGGRPVTTTRVTQLNWPTRSTPYREPHRTTRTTADPPECGTSPAMAARWSWLAARRCHKPVATKWRGPGPRVAHRECSGATGRR